jgi:hypothetical protein
MAAPPSGRDQRVRAGAAPVRAPERRRRRRERRGRDQFCSCFQRRRTLPGSRLRAPYDLVLLATNAPLRPLGWVSAADPIRARRSPAGRSLFPQVVRAESSERAGRRSDVSHPDGQTACTNGGVLDGASTIHVRCGRSPIQFVRRAGVPVTLATGRAQLLSRRLFLGLRCDLRALPEIRAGVNRSRWPLGTRPPSRALLTSSASRRARTTFQVLLRTWMCRSDVRTLTSPTRMRESPSTRSGLVRRTRRVAV